MPHEVAQDDNSHNPLLFLHGQNFLVGKMQNSFSVLDQIQFLPPSAHLHMPNGLSFNMFYRGIEDQCVVGTFINYIISVHLAGYL